MTTPYYLPDGVVWQHGAVVEVLRNGCCQMTVWAGDRVLDEAWARELLADGQSSPIPESYARAAETFLGYSME